MKSDKIICLKEGDFKGSLSLPPSKSLSHRYLMGAALSKGKSVIKNIANSEDILSTIKIMETLGAKFNRVEVDKNISNYEIIGVDSQIDFEEGSNFFANESGSTLRFIIPLLLLSDKKARLTGAGKLVDRPLDTYYKIFLEKGIYYKNNNGSLPLDVKGPIGAGEFLVEGNVSSQFITGLLMALPLLDEDSTIKIINNLESKPYVDLTLQALTDFGIEVINEDYQVFKIKGKQSYQAISKEVEGDMSQLAFFAVLGAISEKDITVNNINPNSLQGDKVIIDILKDMQADIDISGLKYTFKKSKLVGTTIDVKDCPDLVPALSLLATMASGTTRIINAKRLRIKESDRLAASRELINTLGGRIKEFDDGLEIEGVAQLTGGLVSSFNDHRIAMTASMARAVASDDIYLEGYEAVAKSFTNFFEVYESIGGRFSYE